MPTLTLARPKVFKDVKEAPALVLIFILASEIGLNWLYVNLLYGAFSIPATLTEGVVSPLIVLSMVKLFFIVFGVVFWIGQFNKWHLGLNITNFKTSILSTFFLWVFLQAALMLFSVFSNQENLFLSSQNIERFLLLLGSFFVFAITKALYDEIVYRSLILPQFHLKIQRFVNVSPKVALVIAILISQIIYLIIQTPLISIGDISTFNMAFTFGALFVLGILNSLVYLRTKNIYVAVGIHTLWFYPMFIVEASLPHMLILAGLVSAFIIVWPMLPNTSTMKATWPIYKQ